MKSFIVNSKDLLDKEKNPHLLLSPEKIEKNPKIRKKYLACIWCGNRIPNDRPYAKYCRDKCKREALGQKLNLCPKGGDSRHCEECAYYPDYKFNPDTGECEVNKQ